MINKLKEYVAQLHFSDLESRLEKIAYSMENGTAPLTLPLVGEFSAGKTTLINALSDSKALQSASEPTTATIYTLKFGAPANHAIIHYQDATISETDNISELDNKSLIDATVVEVFDTSSKVPSTIMLVDTPGLSSHDIKHRQNLVDFLPQADGVLLTVDVNQPITKSLTEFARTIELSKRPLYMILTQCDTKSEKDIEAQKQYILNNTELHLSGIACVSAKNGDLGQFDSLLASIQKDKTHILQSVNDFRLKEIVKEMIARIDTLLNADESDDTLEDEIRSQQLKLNKLRRELDNITQDVEADVEEVGRKISRQFEDEIFTRLESVITGSSNNFDAEAISAINNTASIMFSDFKSQALRVFGKHASKCPGISAVNLSEIEAMDLSGCYNINLNEAGHEYDSKIGTALKVAAVATAVVLTAGAAGGAAAAGTATAGGATAAGTAAGGATAAGTAAAGTAAAGAAGGLSVAEGALLAADVADTATDIASMVSNKKHADRIDRLVEYGTDVSDKLDKVNDYDQKTGQRVGTKKGIVSSMVGFFTERTMGRPQRRRVITQYIDSTLAPTFNAKIGRIGREIVKVASTTIINDSQASVESITESLNELKKNRETQRSEYEAQIQTLRTIKKELQNI